MDLVSKMGRASTEYMIGNPIDPTPPAACPSGPREDKEWRDAWNLFQILKNVSELAAEAAVLKRDLL